MSSGPQPPVYSGEITEHALADPNNTHAILIGLVGNNREVLEIGPATGYMTRVLVERQGCRVTGFEKDAAAAAQAKRYFYHLIMGDLEDPDDLARIEGKYDVVLVADVLEHLAWPETALRALRKHIRVDGRLIVSLPNVAHWSIRRALLFGRWDMDERGLMDRTHLRWYTLKTARELLESAGYRVQLHRCSYGFPAHWRRNFGQRLAAWAQKRTMPRAFDGLFAIQHIFVAVIQ